MSGRRSKEKGRKGEIEWAKFLTDFGWPAHRGRQYAGGHGTPDVKGGIPDTHAEVKRTEKLSLYEAMEQAIGDAGDDVPYVAHRRNNKPWLVVLRAEDIVRFARAVVAASNDVVIGEDFIGGPFHQGKCPHGEDPAECPDCLLASDHAHDAAREARFFD